MITQLGALVVQLLAVSSLSSSGWHSLGRGSKIHLLAVSLECQVAAVSCLQAAATFLGATGIVWGGCNQAEEREN